MSNESIFRTPEGEAEYMAAYDATLELWPVPYDSLHIPTRIGSTHVIASGPEGAPPVILLHMAGTSATMWYPNVAGLSRSYRVYAVDVMNDLGKSVPSRPRNTRKVSAEWLLDVFDAFKIDQACVVGASNGGWVTLNLAIYAPQRVERIVLLAPAGSFAPLSLKFFVAMLPVLLFPRPSVIRKATQSMVAKGSTVGDERLTDQLTAGFRHCRIRSMMGMAAPTVFADDELRQLAVPVLLLLGEQEMIYNPQKVLNRATRLIPDIEAEIIPNTGHGLSVEQPEIVNARILDFIAREDA